MQELEQYDIDRDRKYENGQPGRTAGIQLEIPFPETLELSVSHDNGKTWNAIAEIKVGNTDIF